MVDILQAADESLFGVRFEHSAEKRDCAGDDN